MATRATDADSDLSSAKSQRDWLDSQAPRWLRPASLVLALGDALVLIAQAGLIAWCMHSAIVLATPVHALWGTLWGLLGLLILRAGLSALRGLVSAHASASVRRNVRRKLFDHLCQVGAERLRPLGTGELVTQLNDHVEALDAYYARFKPQVASALVIPAGIVVAITFQNWLAGLLLALTAPLIPVFMALVGMGAEQLSRNQHQALARLSGVFHDRLHGLDTIRRFGAEAREQSRIAEFSRSFRQRTMAVLRLAFLSSAVLEFIAAVAIAMLAIYIGLGLLGYIEFGPAATLNLGSGLFILLLAPEFFAPLRTLAQHWHDRAGALAAAGSIRPLLELPPARHATGRPVAPQLDQSLSVRVSDLTFAWPGRTTVLHELELDIEAGEHVLITGASGCGKSTLISLLAGFMSADQGTIRFGSIDQADLDSPTLAQLRAWLGQTPVLFPGTIAENIALGREQAGRTDIERVAELCRVGAFADCLPLGLDTPIGQDGFGFSGGQGQRIALARALLEPRPLLMLDEPTSGLDADSEQAIWKAIRKATKSTPMTVIAASHSPLARQWADRILHMHNGRLVETAA
jgi:ATP-binding cassette, subfamily C, bacterial CydD